jgi:hypothetical protein
MGECQRAAAPNARHKLGDAGAPDRAKGSNLDLE